MEPIETSGRDDAAERFVLDQMEGRELDDYLARLMLDPALQSEVAATRERIKTLRGMQRPYTASGWRNWRMLLFLPLLLVTGALLFWFLRPTPSVQAPPPIHQETEQPAKQEPVAIKPDLPADPAPEQGNRRYAADLRPNPALEYMLGAGQYRSTDPQGFHWTRAPETQPVFASHNGKTRFNLDLAAEAPAKLVSRLQWQIFTNKPGDYEAGRSEHSGQFIVTSSDADTHTVSVQTDLNLRPGLYYYLIEDRETGDIFFVGKFVVE